MVKPGSETNASRVAKIASLVLCAGAGCALAGVSAGTSVEAMAASTMFASIFGDLTKGVASNLATFFVEKFSDFFGESVSRPKHPSINHDLNHVAAKAVHDTIGAAWNAVDKTADYADQVAQLQRATIAQIAEALENVSNDELTEEDVQAVIGTPMGGTTTSIKIPAFWLDIVTQLADATRDSDRHLGSGSAWIAAVGPSSADANRRMRDAIGFVANYLHVHVAAQVNDNLRSDTELGKRARVAAEFAYLRAIAVAMEDVRQSTLLSEQRLDELKSSIANACTSLSSELRGLSDANREFLESLRAHATATAATLTALGIDATILRTTIDTIDNRLREIAELLAAVDAGSRERDGQTHERLNAISAAITNGRTSRRTDNLSEASAQQNSAFVGRSKLLETLSDLLHRADGPAAVAIVGGAGFGKTELAKQFVNARARPATFDAGAASFASHEWTHRWWIDGSRSGEAVSLHEHFTAITGQPFPEEPRGNTDDAAANQAHSRSRLRKAIASACSSGKQLLILDNAESSEQILDYRPANAGRLLVTTRRQRIAPSIAATVEIEAMSPGDAHDILCASRAELREPEHEAPLEQIGEHLGYHALALAYAAAALARRPHISPRVVLAQIQRAEIGDPNNILSEFDEQALGTRYRLGLAQSLALLIDDLSGDDDVKSLALELSELAAFCEAAPIPLELLRSSSGASEREVDKALRILDDCSVISLGTAVSMHRLTQSLLRQRVVLAGNEMLVNRVSSLLNAAWVLSFAADNDQLRPVRSAAAPHITRIACTALDSKDCESIHKLAADCLHVNAEHLFVISDLASAAMEIARAVAWAEAQVSRDERRIAIWYGTWAEIRKFRGDLSGADADIARAIAWQEAQVPLHECELATSYSIRASIREARGDHSGAEVDLNWAIAWAEEQKPRNDRTLAIRYSKRAYLRQTRYEFTGGEADIDWAIAWGEKQTPRDERALAICYASRAHLRRSRAEYSSARVKDSRARADLSGAEADIARAITWGEGQEPRDERILALWYAERACLREDLGDAPNAEADIAQAIAWAEKQEPRNGRMLATFCAVRGKIRYSRGDLRGAEADIAFAIAWGEKQKPRNEGELAVLCTLRARVRQDRGNLRGAEADIARVIAWRKAQQPRDGRQLAESYATRAGLRCEAKSYAAARSDINRTLKWWMVNLPDDTAGLAQLRRLKASIPKK